ncbi:hypothetical protein NIES4073_68360 [Kalymmatonema gypsitolerans NIES-4073]|nr:hypothetical protein NIES4073_68360 [Scytonema sp. NIES-4073]
MSNLKTTKRTPTDSYFHSSYIDLVAVDKMKRIFHPINPCSRRDYVKSIIISYLSILAIGGVTTKVVAQKRQPPNKQDGKIPAIRYIDDRQEQLQKA